MATSGHKFKSEEKNEYPEDDPIDVMPSPCGFWNMPPSIAANIAGYAWDMQMRPSLFSGFDSTLGKILFIAEHAGPLERFEYLVTLLTEREILANKARTLHTAEHYTLIDTIFILGDAQGTLMQHLVIRGDVTVRSENGTAIDEGMAECFAQIIQRLLPHRYQDILSQKKMAAPLEDIKTKEQRDSANLTKLEKVFNIYKREEKYIQSAIQGCDLSLAFLHNEDIETMEDLLVSASVHDIPVLVYIKNSDKLIMGGDPLENGNWTWTNLNFLTSEDQNFLKKLPFDQRIIKRQHIQFKSLIGLLKPAHGLMETINDFVENIKSLAINDKGYKINNLPNDILNHLLYGAFDLMGRKGDELPGGRFGSNADLFCFQIIGGALQMDLQPRLMQILSNKKGGISALFKDKEKAARFIDANRDLFRGVGSGCTLGMNSYYGVFGPAGDGRSAVALNLDKMLRLSRSGCLVAEFFLMLRESNVSSIEALCSSLTTLTLLQNKRLT